MSGLSTIFNKIAEALLIDYTIVYYVNTATGEYVCYSLKPESHALRVEEGGHDFFADADHIAQNNVFPDDQAAFLTEMQKDRLLDAAANEQIQGSVFRLMIDGKPVYHRLRLIHEVGKTEDYFIIGMINIDREVRAKLDTMRLEKEREQFNQIAHSLASHYDTIYYVNMETNHYIEFSSTDVYKLMNVPPEGDDFFSESAKNVERYVHPDDRDKVEALYNKEALLKNLEAGKAYAVTYRLVVMGETMHCRHLEMWAEDRKHIIICVENVNEEFEREEALRRAMAVNVTYSQIAERLLDRYDTIYYVDAESEEYIEFSSTNLLQALYAPPGSSFFTQAKKNIPEVVHQGDRVMVYAFLDKGLLLEGLHYPDIRQLEYRIVISGVSYHVRLSVMFTKDQRHLLFCVENIDR
ncbi:MAG: hypothetical protein J5449_05805 [Oscillospiraceae bacterium]|nr:hypothetical protein [Oscillospiraceae bacterium]